ncbi:8550_t:CDS:2, partial [Scutellospora calospora]
MKIMDAGGVQVQHQPSSQDPTRQSWRNNNSNGDQGKRRDSGSNKSRPVNLKSINVERAQSMNNTSRTAGSNNNISGVQPLRTPKTSQFPRPNQHVYAVQSTKTPTLVKTSPPPPQNVFVSRSPPLQAYNNLSRSPPKDNSPAPTSKQNQQKTASSSRPTPKPLNLSKSSSHVSNLGRVPQTATFPPKVNRALNLPNPPKTATFATKSSGFPKDIRQSVRAPQSATLPQPSYAFIYNDQTYVQTVEPSRFRRYSSTPAPLRFVTADYRQVQLGPGTPVVVLSHPDDSDSQGSSPPTPGYGPPESFNGADIYDLCTMQPCEEEQEEEYVPQTPTGTLHNNQQQQQRSNSLSSKDERRRSVFGGPMKVHSDAVLPIRQPKGPDIAKNFATRIRRKAVNKLYAAAAERRSKSAADRRKSA